MLSDILIIAVVIAVAVAPVAVAFAEPWLIGTATRDSSDDPPERSCPAT